MSLSVTPISCLTDNYAWCFDTGAGAAVVDPGEAAPVLRWLESQGLALRWILVTHHHGDHTGGILALHQHTGAAVLGAAADHHRLPPLDLELEDGDEPILGDLHAHVVSVPGHTTAHVAYLVDDVLFAGDVLFAFGCGRVFEGTPAQMWASLDRLRSLPGATRLCCGHEYTIANLRFARHLLPDSEALTDAAVRSIERRQKRQPTLPADMDEQRALNPFLRCDDPELLAELGLEGYAPAQVFAEIRGRKDRF